MFRRIEFPTDDFFPPKVSDVCSETGTDAPASRLKKRTPPDSEIRRGFSDCFSNRAKLAISFLVPTFSNAISSSVSLPMGVAERTMPLPKVLCDTLSPARKRAEFGFLLPGFVPKLRADSAETARDSLEETGSGTPVPGFFQ